jgi:outer membrane protein
MLKRIALIVLMALPVGVFAQSQKFGHMNSEEIIPSMPEYTKAVSDLQALEKKYTDELQRTQEEFNKKYQEFQQAMSASEPLPQNIAERRQKELQDMMQRQEQFQQEAQQGMQKAQQDLMTPIYQKLNTAIQTVGEAEGVIYVFDLARTQIPYVGAQSIDLTSKVKSQLGIK